MNNKSTSRQPLRTGESVDVLALQILGLITREGQGAFFLTEKFERLKLAVERQERGYMLLRDEELLIEECRVLMPLH